MKEIWSREQVAKLPLKKKIILKILGYVFLRHEKREGWTSHLPIYLVHCKKHNCYFEDYPHGHLSYFNCPKCIEEGINSIGGKSLSENAESVM